ncbi:TrkA-C domain-containing protein [Dethiosulfatibacter aminovorans DSM 17477]|uniref:TrkA-C domain-containing protein n=1 Tax=Dethiosulfatibacter aminovorans DSM 17477 TaxID=1121476 RepID=A0A1M6CAE8_9FIRM|nr:SLC13 family permease [Dethiosulfatibacter aminovorans]SHI57774.1 TrkA-C domain-containing protein [Dethiosulfatibacter aminovorans DSM 17477]
MDVVITYCILILAIILFVTEKLRPDIVAILIMILLAWSGVIEVGKAFSGFSSNAVVSIMAVMIMGYGIDKSGIMKKLSKKIIRLAGNGEKKLLVYVSLSVGLISSFMQNIGAAALFLPALRRICRRTGIHPSKLLMPMGFAAILGGTITMVASGPLIILNDLITQRGYGKFNLFSVTPVGLVLLASGILYFYTLGSKVLPKPEIQVTKTPQNILKEIYDLPDNVFEIMVNENSRIVGKTIEEIDLWSRYNINILAMFEDGSTVYAPWRRTRFQVGQVLAVLGTRGCVENFTGCCSLSMKEEMEIFSNIKNEEYAGFAEIIVPPKSAFIGKSLCEIAVRKNFSVEPIIFISREGEQIDFFERPMESGQEMIVFGRWVDIRKIKEIRDFAVLTPITASVEDESGNKWIFALGSLLFAIAIVLAGVRLSLGFLTGAFLMILTKVIPLDEVYSAIDWKTVFLLAGLIPLGLAFEESGAAAITAGYIIEIIKNWGTLPIMFVIGILATLFSLFMSNNAATVLLVPLVMIMGEQFGINPRALAILVAICTSNSFVLPTHQVNAFLMTPGGYNNSDYIKAGGIMTAIFLVVAVLLVYILFI